MEPWYQKAAERMARENKSLFVVSNELDLGMTAKQCIDLEKTKDFAACYRGERLKYYKELASDPQRSKETLVGQMLVCADELFKKDAPDKAARVLMDLAKIQGYMDASTNLNIFGSLTASDLEATKARLKKMAIEAVN